jgi:hypothetical protein
MIGKNDIAKKINAMLYISYRYFLRMKLQLQMTFKKLRYRLNKISQLSATRSHYCKIIGITGIMFYMQTVLNELIKLIHINIREKLGGQIADWNTGF